jgi:Flp pilus assembly pilin Flp
MVKALVRSKKGAALVEYSLLVAGVALIGAAAVSIFGHKTADLMASVAAVLPGAHADDNGALVAGKLIETTVAGVGAGGAPIALDIAGIAGASGQERLGNNLLGATANTGAGALSTLVVEAN